VDNWVDNRRRLRRLLIRARVANLQSVPQWIVFSNRLGSYLDSWTIQCEVVSHNFVSGGPPVEDPVPNTLTTYRPSISLALVGLDLAL
jgi:hypothetical protein